MASRRVALVRSHEICLEGTNLLTITSSVSSISTTRSPFRRYVATLFLYFFLSLRFSPFGRRFHPLLDFFEPISASRLAARGHSHGVFCVLH